MIVFAEYSPEDLVNFINFDSLNFVYFIGGTNSMGNSKLKGGVVYLIDKVT